MYTAQILLHNTEGILPWYTTLPPHHLTTSPPHSSSPTLPTYYHSLLTKITSHAKNLPYSSPLAKLFGDLSIVDVGIQLDDLLPLDVGEDHEGVHRPLDVVRGVLLGLQQAD